MKKKYFLLTNALEMAGNCIEGLSEHTLVSALTGAGSSRQERINTIIDLSQCEGTGNSGNCFLDIERKSNRINGLVLQNEKENRQLPFLGCRK